MDDPQQPSSPGQENQPTEQVDTRADAAADRPTEVIGSTGTPGYTADPARAYGTPSRATRTYTTYDELRAQQDDYGPDPAAYPVDFAEQPHRSSWGLVGVGIGVGLLLAVIIGACVLLLGRHGSGDSGNVAVGGAGSSPVIITTTAPEPTTTTPLIPPPHVTGASPTLALPLNELGATMGTVTSNDGVTVLVRRMFGDHVRTVHTDTATKVMGMGGSTVADLKVGDVVIAQGDGQPDGSLNARLIIQL